VHTSECEAEEPDRDPRCSRAFKLPKSERSERSPSFMTRAACFGSDRVGSGFRSGRGGLGVESGWEGAYMYSVFKIHVFCVLRIYVLGRILLLVLVQLELNIGT
jgi:hypothetical protein